MTATLQPIAEVIEPGFYTSLQDFGRFGQLAHGVTRGGPVDEQAFLWANRLLENSYNAAQLEITAGGLQLRFLADAQICITGAAVRVTVDQQLQPSWQVLNIAAGSQLQIAAGPSGLRSYLAIQGGFQARAVAGSVATVRRDQRGGLHGDGRALQASDLLQAPAQTMAIPQRRPQRDMLTPLAVGEPLTLSIIPSGQYQQFSEAARQLLVSQLYRVTPAHDRMGVRLAAEQPIAWEHAQLISEPLPVGAVQLPPDGQPIIMLNDRQTLGGYPKIATLSWSARCLVAQASTSTLLQFRWQSLAEAQAEWCQVAQFFHLPRSG